MSLSAGSPMSDGDWATVDRSNQSAGGWSSKPWKPGPSVDVPADVDHRHAEVVQPRGLLVCEVEGEHQERE
ncbi:hypothetical protein ABT373_03895 [Streptomyces sp. NPDC000070]|uniref:hypothetical protein n=1 Tax=Streptomyces sp. NPDC000070 TaxID=3154240 RepID=UPI0033250B1F